VKIAAVLLDLFYANGQRSRVILENGSEFIYSLK